MSDEAKRFLIVQITRIGDMILLSPLLNAIKADNPRHHITVLAGKYNVAVCKQIPNIDHVLLYDKKWYRYFSHKKMIQEYPHDIYIDPKDHYSGESALLAGFSRANIKIGFNAPHKTEQFNRSIPSDIMNSEKHAVERNLQICDCLHIQQTALRLPSIRSTLDSDQRLQEFLPSAQVTAYSLINFSASVEDRKWHPHRWIELLREFPEQQFLISCEEKDREKIAEILNSCHNSYYYKTRHFSDLISLVKFADIVLSPDTSVIHIASAFNKAVIGLYQNDTVNINKFKPLSDLHRIIMHSQTGALIPTIPSKLVISAYREICGVLYEN